MGNVVRFEGFVDQREECGNLPLGASSLERLPFHGVESVAPLQRPFDFVRADQAEFRQDFNPLRDRERSVAGGVRSSRRPRQLARKTNRRAYVVAKIGRIA
jgi:hypothetical protein